MADSLHSLSDTQLLDVAQNAFAVAATDPPAYGFVLADITAMQADRTTFGGDVTAQTAAQAAAKAATQTKKMSRDTLENDLRSLRDHAKSAGADPAQVAALGLPAGGGGLAATVPVAMVNTSERMRHRISWMDAASPGSKARPLGVMGAEIWRKIDGPPPTDESTCTFVTLDSASPYDINYTGAEGGKIAHYLLRWHFKDGSLGAWGETASATITA